MRSISWQVDRLKWRSWAEDFIVYNISSGNTHTLTPTAATILKFLEEAPRTIERLSQSIAAENGVDCDGELVAHVARLIANLDELGLVHPAC